ncbi:hypothetical protein EVAR_36447_1 [Eumeta japonica]|uniref:Uncharacterized protein n=1 Tax=Eumeta variegata TaxID=151549 RepID=A0A4C1VPY0_EUMVA|nr:hypothetical protein EVAR_36447_1 [Eumeta japonica]
MLSARLSVCRSRRARLHTILFDIEQLLHPTDSATCGLTLSAARGRMRRRRRGHCGDSDHLRRWEPRDRREINKSIDDLYSPKGCPPVVEKP